MASKRWVQQAQEAFEKANIYTGKNDLVMRVTLKLLARQHAAVVRMVKKEIAISKNWAYEGWVPGYRKACEVILAALATHRKGRT